MAVKIRLTRMGRHKDPVYRIVVADSRFARDGRYIEQVGYFNPNAKGQTPSVTLNNDKILEWLNNGAIPSDTVKSILSDAGIIKAFAESKVKKGE